MTRRRTALLLLSIAWIGHGITIWHQPGYRDLDEAIIFELWPLALRIGIWIGCGLIGAAGALSGRRRWEAIGYGLAMIPPLIRVLSYGWSVIAWVVPGAPGGEWASIAYAAYWVALLWLVHHVSHWPEPGRTTNVA